MSWQEITESLSQFFISLSMVESLMLLVALLLAFFLGWLLTRLYFRSKFKKLREVEIEKDKLLAEVRIKQESLISEIELKTADLKKAEISLNNLQGEYKMLSDEKEQLRIQLEQLNSEEIFLDDQNDDTANNEAASLFNKEQVQELFKQTEQRIATLETRIQELENEDREVLIVNADDLDDEAEIDSGNLAEAKVKEARQVINKALGERIVNAEAANKDDLKKINGIGPFIEQKLNELGIYSYEQISQFDAPFIQSLTEAIQFFPGRIERDDWVGQAKKLK